MTREAFIKVLDKNRYSYKIVGDKIVVTDRRNFLLSSLETLPPDVQFNNSGHVELKSLETLPPGVQFRNIGYVDLSSLMSLSPDVKFENKGYVYLDSLKTLPPGVEFKNRGDILLGINGGDVFLNSLIGGWFREWKGNIKDIDSKRLINKMISLGLFDKE